MRRVYLAIILVFCIMLFTEKSKAAEIDLNKVITCDNLTTTPLIINSSVLAIIFQICLDDVRCRDIFGQGIMTDEELSTLSMNFKSVSTQNPLCGKTIGQVFEMLWLVTLKKSMLNHDLVFASDAFPVFIGNGPTYH